MVYASDYYRAFITAYGMKLTIQPLDQNNEVGPEIVHSFRVFFTDPSKPSAQKHKGRAIARFDTLTEPVMIGVAGQPGSRPPPGGYTHTAVLSGVLDDDVFFAYTFEFEPTVIRFSTVIKDPEGIAFSSRGDHSVSVRQSLDAKDYASLDDIKAASEGWEITLDGKDMRETTFPFWPMLHTSTGGVDTLITKGPWGSRILHVDMPPTKYRDAEPRFTTFSPTYTGRPALDGFRLYRPFYLSHGDFEAAYTITFK